MLATIDPIPTYEDITISIHFVDGDSFVQTLTIDEAEGVQDFIGWFRNPGKCKVWTFQVPSHARLHCFNHANIMGVDIEGYVELEGRPSRWYEKLIDRFRAWRLT